MMLEDNMEKALEQQLKKWGVVKNSSPDVEILINTILPNLLSQQKQNLYSKEDMKKCWRASSAHTIGNHKVFKQTHPDFKQWLKKLKNKKSHENKTS